MNGRLKSITGIGHAGGACFTAPAPVGSPAGDDIRNGYRSTMRLFEGDRELGPAHSLHEDIIKHGGGRFSHWGNGLMFSSSDGSDPRTNGHSYSVVYSVTDDPRVATLIAAQKIDFERLGPEARYHWGERAFNALVPDVRLSEYGRTMFHDRDFLADYERFDGVNYRSFDRKFALLQLLGLALPVEGDVIECGVFQGASAYMMAKLMARTASTKRLHLFDSFAGVSDPDPKFDGSYWQRGHLSCGLEEVASRLRDFRTAISFYPGWIPDRFLEADDKRFCFAHIDVDLHQPTRDSLEFILPRMSVGGIIVCDDYGFETCPGARTAMDDFAAVRHLKIVHLPTGQGVIFVGR